MLLPTIYTRLAIVRREPVSTLVAVIVEAGDTKCRESGCTWNFYVCGNYGIYAI